VTVTFHFWIFSIIPETQVGINSRNNSFYGFYSSADFIDYAEKSTGCSDKFFSIIFVNVIAMTILPNSKLFDSKIVRFGNCRVVIKN